MVAEGGSTIAHLLPEGWDERERTHNDAAGPPASRAALAAQQAVPVPHALLPVVGQQQQQRQQQRKQQRGQQQDMAHIVAEQQSLAAAGRVHTGSPAIGYALERSSSNSSSVVLARLAGAASAGGTCGGASSHGSTLHQLPLSPVATQQPSAAASNRQVAPLAWAVNSRFGDESPGSPALLSSPSGAAAAGSRGSCGQGVSSSTAACRATVGCGSPPFHTPQLPPPLKSAAPASKSCQQV